MKRDAAGRFVIEVQHPGLAARRVATRGTLRAGRRALEKTAMWVSDATLRQGERLIRTIRRRVEPDHPDIPF